MFELSEKYKRKIREEMTSEGMIVAMAPFFLIPAIADIHCIHCIALKFALLSEIGNDDMVVGGNSQVKPAVEVHKD